MCVHLWSYRIHYGPLKQPWCQAADLSRLSPPAACGCLGAQWCQCCWAQPMARRAGGDIKHFLWSMLRWMSETLILLEIFFTEIFTERILFFWRFCVRNVSFWALTGGVSPLRDSKRSRCCGVCKAWCVYFVLFISLGSVEMIFSWEVRAFRWLQTCCSVSAPHSVSVGTYWGVLMPEAFTAVGDGSEQNTAGEH